MIFFLVFIIESATGKYRSDFNSRIFKTFAEYVAYYWQVLRVGQVLYFAAKNKILKVLAISAQLQTWEIKSQIPKFWNKKSRGATWCHLMMFIWEHGCMKNHSKEEHESASFRAIQHNKNL